MAKKSADSKRVVKFASGMANPSYFNRQNEPKFGDFSMGNKTGQSYTWQIFIKTL